MRVVRPIREADLDALLEMAQSAGSGFTSLPPDRNFLSRKIERSQRSFASDVHTPGPERYLFVLEDTDRGEIGGCCAIEAACGLDEAFYNYHVGLAVHASRELQIYHRIPTLYLSNDYTGSSVLCSLYLRPNFRNQNSGKLLSKSRLLFIANHPQRFAGRVIAEMRGVSNEQGRSPFWEGLGRHFFGIDYNQAEHIVGTGNKAFIAELMPPHPIYTVLLPPEARAVMGQVHPQTAPALHLLQREGFRYQGYIDIFDGGPTVEAPTAAIRSLRRSRLQRVDIAPAAVAGSPYLIANNRLQDFRCGLASLAPHQGDITLEGPTAQALGLAAGDTARVVAL